MESFCYYEDWNGYGSGYEECVGCVYGNNLVDCVGEGKVYGYYCSFEKFKK